MTEKSLQLTSSFRVNSTIVNNQRSYEIPRIFPQVDTPIRAIRRRLTKEKGEPNVGVSREAGTELLQAFLADTQAMGLDLGQKNQNIKLLRVAGVGVGDSLDNPDLQPGYGRVRIKDNHGNDVTFRMKYEMQSGDDQDREWDKVIIHMERATINGKRVHLTPEMKREGFTFRSHNMNEILEQARNNQPTTAVIRQETPDAACFYDGHHTSAGIHELGCRCKEERAESLSTIHKRGGINALMPGTGNGNGSEAQDIQISVRNSAARRGKAMLSYHDIYGRMGKKEDARHEALSISTFIMENLFQLRDVPSFTVLTDSRAKRETWNMFGKHQITAEPLASSPRSHIDYQSKQQRFGYGSGAGSFPLMPSN